jgi:hypothetical protein
MRSGKQAAPVRCYGTTSLPFNISSVGTPVKPCPFYQNILAKLRQERQAGIAKTQLIPRSTGHTSHPMGFSDSHWCVKGKGGGLGIV